MDLSPSAWLEAATPYVLAVAAVTLAFVAAFAVAVFAVLHFLLRRRRRRWLRDDASGAPAQDGLDGFTWTSTED
ncbi:hypothetical protein J7F03_17870 [Streptomyces sp. ISL-43]|uniref:hypothetical protein n=1 Tax=Streptomyces sp. ISL-43 TaxID=2819183 RepID=UPI001BE8BC6C|nr:hypothetical protein [Streptomyces sp. ISL-43]MBT2448927.1 hypothetical protein [Streptomyces sp. ISL-43]